MVEIKKDTVCNNYNNECVQSCQKRRSAQTNKENIVGNGCVRRVKRGENNRTI
jgi:hypothetical protein